MIVTSTWTAGGLSHRGRGRTRTRTGTRTRTRG